MGDLPYMGDRPDIEGLTYCEWRYGDHKRQQLGVWEYPTRAPLSERPASGHWIVFIHGGAWRDPRNTWQDFKPSIRHMISPEGIAESTTKGFISIDYRLSHSPPASSDTAEAGARHPDHILDIRAALAFLSSEYHIDNDYVLVGHSAGAMLALQVLMGRDALAGDPTPEVPLPAAIVGISGIYDLAGINARHDGQYAGFITDAFGSDKEAWDRASPACYSGNFKANWIAGHLALLAWSPGDTLVDEPEIDAMATKLARDEVNVHTTKNLTGEHDTVWREGEQVCQLVKDALTRLQQV